MGHDRRHLAAAEGRSGSCSRALGSRELPAPQESSSWELLGGRAGAEPEVKGVGDRTGQSWGTPLSRRFLLGSLDEEETHLSQGQAEAQNKNVIWGS